MLYDLFLTTRLSGSFAPVFYFNCKYLLVVQIVKKRKKLWIFKILRNKLFFEANIFNFDHSWTFFGVLWGPTQSLGWICSAVLPFIGYTQTETQSIYMIDIPILQLYL